MYTGFGYVAAAHSLTESSNGLRPPGEYQTGGIVAVDPSTNRVRWKKRMPYSLAHGNGILTTASDLLFIGQPDGNLLALDAERRRRAVALPDRRGDQRQPDHVRDRRRAVRRRRTPAAPAFRTATRHRAATTCGRSRSAARCRRPPTPTPPVVRRPVSGSACRGQRRRQHRRARANLQRGHQHGRRDRIHRRQRMAPTHLRVPVGTTVTFTNPASNPNTHCATQFFEGLFNFRLAPGESATYTFTQAGRVLLQRLLQPAADRQGRGRATTIADPSRQEHAIQHTGDFTHEHTHEAINLVGQSRQRWRSWRPAQWPAIAITMTIDDHDRGNGDMTATIRLSTCAAAPIRAAITTGLQRSAKATVCSSTRARRVRVTPTSGPRLAAGLNPPLARGQRRAELTEALARAGRHRSGLDRGRHAPGRTCIATRP